MCPPGVQLLWPCIMTPAPPHLEPPPWGWGLGPAVMDTVRSGHRVGTYCYIKFWQALWGGWIILNISSIPRVDARQTKFSAPENPSTTIFAFFYARLSISQGITYPVPPNWKSHFQSRVLDRRANFTRQIEKIDWMEMLLSKYYFQTKGQVPVRSGENKIC